MFCCFTLNLRPWKVCILNKGEDVCNKGSPISLSANKGGFEAYPELDDGLIVLALE
jgi:hypothetical protein